MPRWCPVHTSRRRSLTLYRLSFRFSPSRFWVSSKCMAHLHNTRIAAVLRLGPCRVCPLPPCVGLSGNLDAFWKEVEYVVATLNGINWRKPTETRRAFSRSNFSRSAFSHSAFSHSALRFSISLPAISLPAHPNYDFRNVSLLLLVRIVLSLTSAIWSTSNNARHFEIYARLQFGFAYQLAVILEDTGVTRREGTHNRFSNSEQELTSFFGTQNGHRLRRTRRTSFQRDSKFKLVLSDLRYPLMSGASGRRWRRWVRPDTKVRLAGFLIQGPKSYNHRGRGAQRRWIFQLRRHNSRSDTVRLRALMGHNNRSDVLHRHRPRAGEGVVYKVL